MKRIIAGQITGRKVQMKRCAMSFFFLMKTFGFTGWKWAEHEGARVWAKLTPASGDRSA
uniref:Uncharacterized protein n=1 Tax=Anguilla anguilla TaxID=7936 RepID=A0A0E9X1E6_ANGAN